MALRIPDTRESAPAQQAFNQIDPSQKFGQVREQLAGMPDVPNGLGQKSLVDGSEVAQGTATIANGFDNIVQSLNNVQARDKALKTAQEHMQFKESELAAKKQLIDAEREIEEKAAAEYWTPDQKKEAMALKRSEILTATFDPALYTDETLKGNTKLAIKQYELEHGENYLRSVIEPERVAAIEGGIVKTIEYTLSLAATSKSPEEVQAAHASLNELFNSPGFLALSPQKRMQYAEKAHMGVEVGVADHVLNSLPADNPVKAKAMLDAMIKNPAMLPLLNTGDRDDALRKGNNFIEAAKRDIEIKRRQAEADREKRQREWQNNNQYDLMLRIRNGQASEAEVNKAMHSGRIDKQAAVSLLGTLDSHREKIARETEGWRAVETMSANGLRVVDEKLQTAWYTQFKKGLESVPPAQRVDYQIAHYKNKGFVPKEFVNEVKAALNSDDPRVMITGLNTLKKLEAADSRFIGDLDQKTRLLHEQHKSGTPTKQLIEFRDNQRRMTTSEVEQRNTDFETYNGKPSKGKTKAVLKLEKMYDGKITDKMRGVFEDKVKNHFASGATYEEALRMAETDMTRVYDVTTVGRPQAQPKVMQHPPEKVYNQTAEVINARLDKDLKPLGLGSKDVFLYYTGLDKKSGKPAYTIMKINKETDQWDIVRGENNQVVKWHFDVPPEEIAKLQAEKKAELEKDRDTYSKKHGTRIMLDSSSPFKKKTPAKLEYK